MRLEYIYNIMIMTVNQIADYNLYIGDLEDAKTWKGPIICVLERLPNDEPDHALWIPFLKTKYDDGFIEYALPQQLDLISVMIDNNRLQKNKPLLVHCTAGMERSPLAVAWWLSKKIDIPIEESYEIVKKYRPQTMEHLEWIKQG